MLVFGIKYHVARNFCELVILGVLQELRFVIGTDWFLLGINLCNFQKVLTTKHNLTIIIFVFIEYVQ